MLILSGLLFTILIALAASAIHIIYPPISAVLIAVLAGMCLKNITGVPASFQPGVRFAAKRVLEGAIILLGARLSFADLANLGGQTLLIVTICIVIALVLTSFMSKLLRLPPRLGTLIAVGTAICGNSAAIATAGAINAEDDEIGFAVCTITLFGVVAILIYPVIGTLLALEDPFFGTWAGTAINDTAQVVTAGFIYSETAGEISTVVKLTRNLFIAPVVFFFSLLYARGRAKTQKTNYVQLFPWFILGFLFMAAARTLGLFTDPVVLALNRVSGLMITTAVAGIGLNIDFSAMKNIGLKSLYMGLLASSMMGFISYFLIRYLL